MFTAMRDYINFLDIANFADLTTYLGNATFQGGEKIFFRFSKHLYATVNAAGTAVVLATA